MKMPKLRVGYLASNRGEIPFSARADGKYLLQNSGENTGNLAFWHASQAMFDDEVILVKWGSDGAQYRDIVDCLVIPAANHLNPQWDLRVLADLIESLGKEVVVFGLGAQAQEEGDECILQAGTVRYLKALSEYSRTVFVRGPFTATVCEKYGVKNINPIGCPSITINGDPELGVLVESRYNLPLQKLYFAGGAFKNENLMLERALFDVVRSNIGSSFVIQTDAGLIDAAYGRITSVSDEKAVARAQVILDPDTSIEGFLQDFKRIVRCYSSVAAWLEGAAQHDYAVGTRIHGSVMALMAGVPTLVVGHDTRIRELCDVMCIPWLRPADVLADVADLKSLLSRHTLDGVAFDRYRRDVAVTYQKYLQASGFTISSNLRRLSGMEPSASPPDPISTRHPLPQIDLGNQHQRDRSTKLNRYPRIFSAASIQCLQTGQNSGTILSYGCSTGEEVVTLSQSYFRSFDIVGVDVDVDAVKVATENNSEVGRVRFLMSTEANIARYAPYDIIFAMSVFCRWPDSYGIDDISQIYPFNQFEAGVTSLDKYLRVGGLFVIANSNFDFRDTTLSAHYDSLPIQIESSGFVNRFDRNNRATAELPPPDCIFLKRPPITIDRSAV